MGDRTNRSVLFDIPAEDLQRCHDLLGLETWQSLAGERIFITGGTGFIGKWLLATVLDANEKLDLGCSITVLSRDPRAFQRAWPATADKVNWVEGDVRDFPIQNQHYDVIVHGATDVAWQVSPLDVFTSCVDGTRRVLELARQCGARRFLLVSSGAVYGPLPVGITHVSETHMGGPDPLQPSSAYGEGKRVSEWLCAQASKNGLKVKTARVFALVGPHLPLDKHFAIGNFLSSALAGEPVVIKGDGTPFRSYLYAADMAAWLWAVLINGESGRAYNVGSHQSISIAELAHGVLRIVGNHNKTILQNKVASGVRPVHYVPDISRSLRELRMPAPLPLDEAILRTALWHIARDSDVEPV